MLKASQSCPDLAENQKPKSAWKTALEWVAVIGIAALAAWGGSGAADLGKDNIS